jgi:hypothetical protein
MNANYVELVVEGKAIDLNCPSPCQLTRRSSMNALTKHCPGSRPPVINGRYACAEAASSRSAGSTESKTWELSPTR